MIWACFWHPSSQACFEYVLGTKLCANAFGIFSAYVGPALAMCWECFWSICIYSLSLYNVYISKVFVYMFNVSYFKMFYSLCGTHIPTRLIREACLYLFSYCYFPICLHAWTFIYVLVICLSIHS